MCTGAVFMHQWDARGPKCATATPQIECNFAEFHMKICDFGGNIEKLSLIFGWKCFGLENALMALAFILYFVSHCIQ